VPMSAPCSSRSGDNLMSCADGSAGNIEEKDDKFK